MLQTKQQLLYMQQVNLICTQISSKSAMTNMLQNMSNLLFYLLYFYVLFCVNDYLK